MTSLNTMVKRCSGLVDTKDVNSFENAFIKSIIEKTSAGDNTTMLTERQISVLETIFNKHFAG
jgi:hypothetical protein